MNADFDNLPLVEVAIRFTLEKSLPLGVALAHDIMMGIVEDGESAVVRDIPLEPAPGQKVAGFFQRSSFALAHHDGTETIVHPHWVGSKWTGMGSQNYPRFPALRNRLTLLMKRLHELFGEVPKVTVANMSYLNFVSVRGMAEMSAYLQDGVLSPHLLGFGTGCQSLGRWHDASGYELRVELNMSEGALEGEDGFLFTTACGKFLDIGEDPVENLDRIHDNLCNLFVGILSEKAKREWQYQG